MNINRYSSMLMISIVVIAFTAYAKPSYAQQLPEISLSVPAVIQHFSPADLNGDYGLYDCVPAAVTMVLQYFSQADLYTYGANDYASIRLAFRERVPDINRGISLYYIPSTLPSLTDNAISATVLQTSNAGWERLLREQLSFGLPVLAYIPDATLLPGRRQSSSFAHVIVVTGIGVQGVIYNDSWDGRQYTMPNAEFASMWGNQKDPYFAVIFQPVTTLVSDPVPAVVEEPVPAISEKKFKAKKKKQSFFTQLNKFLGIGG